MITTVIAKTPDEAELVRATLQRRVLSLGLFQDGDVGVGVFPEGEEILIRRLSLGGVALHGVGAA
jgi:hypothetical protein